MNQAQRIISQFDKGPSWLAAELGTTPSTVSTWKARGTIPRWWHKAIIDLAVRSGVTLGEADFKLN